MVKPFKNERVNKIFFEAIVVIALYIFSVLSYLIFKPLFSFERNGIVAQSYTTILLVIVISITIFLFIKEKLTFNRLVFLLFIIGFIIKLNYMLITPYGTRQHDTISINNDGHEAYAFFIYNSFKLPDSNAYQFYHPPLNALMQGLFMHISRDYLEIGNSIAGKTIFDLSNKHVLYETTQILSLLYMTITSWVGVKIINEFNVSNKAKLVGYIFMIFFPRLVQLSAQENNDAICVMFSFIAILYSIRYWKDKSWSNLIVIAISIGLAMMSKLSGATICLTTAFIFVYEFIKDCISKDKKKIGLTILKYVVFLAICAPIGLWFQVYAKIRFDQNIGFVFNKLNHNLYTGDHNFFERFINLFDISDMTQSMYCLPFENYNTFGYLVKCSIFGEFSYWQGEGFGVTSVIANYFFILSSLALAVFFLIKTRKTMFKEKVIFISIFAVQYLSYLYFNIKMPYGCTMDFRYIVPIIISFGILLTLSYDTFKKNDFYGVFYKIALCLGAIFLATSSLFYMTCI